MPWTEKDDEEVSDYLVELINKRNELQSQLEPIKIVTSIFKSIQTKEESKFVDNKHKIIKIKPQDKWGESMTDENRLKDKNKCLAMHKKIFGADKN